MYIASRVTERLRILGKLGKIRKILKSHSIILPSAQFPLEKKKKEIKFPVVCYFT